MIVDMESELNMNFNILRPKKVSGHPACMVNFLQSENTDRQTDNHKETL